MLIQPKLCANGFRLVNTDNNKEQKIRQSKNLTMRVWKGFEGKAFPSGLCTCFTIVVVFNNEWLRTLTNWLTFKSRINFVRQPE